MKVTDLVSQDHSKDYDDLLKLYKRTYPVIGMGRHTWYISDLPLTISQQQIDQLCKVSFSQYELAGLTRYEPIVVFDKLRRDDWFKKQRSFNKLKNYERVDPSSKLITWKEAVKISKQTNGDFQEETT